MIEDKLEVYSDKNVIHEAGQIMTPNELKVGEIYLRKYLEEDTRHGKAYIIRITKLDFDKLAFYYSDITYPDIPPACGRFEDLGLIPYDDNKWNAVNWITKFNDKNDK